MITQHRTTLEEKKREARELLAGWEEEFSASGGTAIPPSLNHKKMWNLQWYQVLMAVGESECGREW